MANSFFWYDVMTTDTAAAEAFYRQAIGWGALPPMGEYTVFTLDGDRGVAGLMPIPGDSQAPPVWMTYIAVDDVDAMAARIAAAGGAIHREPCEYPGVIRFAVVADPQGAVFLVAKGLSPETPPPLAPRTPGTVGWRELLAVDGASAFDFYVAMFGWTRAETFDMGPMGQYQLFAAGGEPIGGMMTKPPEVPRPFWGIYFTVEAIGAATERVKAAGGTVLRGPEQVPGGDWVVHCRDPQGAYFNMTAVAA